MEKVRVLVVDDSVVVRRLVSDALALDDGIEIVGTAVDGQAALTKVELLQPDVITMDIEMPRLDGVATVKRLRADGCTTPIIMFSTLTAHGATATLDALAAGASDYVTKPANVGSVSQSLEQVRSQLIPRIKALAPRQQSRAGAPVPVAPRLPVSTPVVTCPSGPTSRVHLVVVASSTGGPEALAQLLRCLPELPVPVAVVQHMPPVFTTQLAARLDRLVPYAVSEARAGVTMAPGSVHIAPGDHHLEVVGRPGAIKTTLTQAPAENFCRPAADVLFRSAATQLGAGVLGVVLTGMGQDGCRGSADLVAAGSSVIAQDAATSVVWGMPGAVTEAGLASRVVALGAMAETVHSLVTASQRRLLTPGSRS